MDLDTQATHRVHHGRSIKRLREILGVKQETIALELNLTQQAVSKLEQREVIEDELIDRVAKILKVPAEAIKNFSEDSTYSFIANTFNSHENAIGGLSYQYNFNPVDKIIELYERMLAAEREKRIALEKLFTEKK